jgi:hypothetical protein
MAGKGRIAGVLEQVAERTARRAATPGVRRASDFKLATGAQGRQRFQAALDDARGAMDPQSRLQVDPFDPKTFDGKVYLSEDGSAGFAITKNGEVVNLFSHPSSPVRGNMDAALTKARGAGATHLHAFDNLAESYGRRGARTTERYPFDPDQAPAGWDVGAMGTPGYNRMDIGGILAPQRVSELAPVEQTALPRHPSPRGEPAVIRDAYAPENLDRLREMIKRGVDEGGDTWYHLQGLKDAWIRELGPEAGEQAFDRFAAHIAATSPRSNVPTNLKRAGFLQHRYLNEAGVDVPLEAFPPGYGHMAHSTAHGPMLADIDAGLPIGTGITRPKATSFYENVRGNYQPLTADGHHNLAVTGRSGSPTDAQYPHLERRAAELGEEFGLAPAETQSAMWVGAKDLTGVHDARGLPEGMNQRIARTAEHFNISEEEALQGFLRGDHYLRSNAAVGGMGAGLGAGILAGSLYTPPENDAMAAPGASRALREALGPAADAIAKSSNTAGRVRRGGIEPLAGQELIEDQIGRVQAMRRSGRITDEQERAALDALWAEYQQAQARGMRDPSIPPQDNIPQDKVGMLDPLESAPQGAVVDDYGGGRGVIPNERYDAGNVWRRDRPLTYAEEMDLALSDQLSMQMQNNKPPATGHSPGSHMADPWWKDEYQTMSPARSYEGAPMGAGQYRPGALDAAEIGGPGPFAQGGTMEPLYQPGMEPPWTQGGGKPIPPATPGPGVDAQGFVRTDVPGKRMYDVAGATGMGVVLADNLADPGFLAEPTMQDDNGRISPRYAPTTLTDAYARPGLEAAREPQAPNMFQRAAMYPARVAASAANVIGGLPGFVRDMGGHYAGAIGSGMEAVLTAPMELGVAAATGQDLQGAIGALADRITARREAVGEPDMDNAIMSSIESLLSKPATMRALEKLMEIDQDEQDRAFEQGAGRYVLYHGATRLPLEL